MTFTHDGPTVHLTLMVDYGDGPRPFLTRWDVVEHLVEVTKRDHAPALAMFTVQGLSWFWDEAKDADLRIVGN